MVSWTWTELAVYSIKDSPKKEPEILIKMFHIMIHCFLDKTQMNGKYCIDILFLFFICVTPSTLASSRRNSAGSHLSSLRRVSRKQQNGILITRNGWIMLLLGSIRSIMRRCIKIDNVFFRKPTFNSLCDPFGSPYRGQKPSLPFFENHPVPLYP